MKEGLQESEMLSFVSARDLPRKPGIVIRLLKMGLYGPAILLCAARVRQQEKKKNPPE